jgi:hypothetical protein
MAEWAEMSGRTTPCDSLRPYQSRFRHRRGISSRPMCSLNCAVPSLIETRNQVIGNATRRAVTDIRCSISHRGDSALVREPASSTCDPVYPLVLPRTLYRFAESDLSEIASYFATIS